MLMMNSAVFLIKKSTLSPDRKTVKFALPGTVRYICLTLGPENMHIIKKLIVLSSLVVVFVSCGPVEYMSKVGITANREFSAAKEAQGEKYSPYEYWSAYYYLHRARHKAGYADYQDANRYGTRCTEMSKRAQLQGITKKKVEVDSGDKNDPETKKSEDKKIENTEKKPVIIIKKDGGN